jgi:hypothetical protein
MEIERIVAAIAKAKSWEDRIAHIRRIPEEFGVAQQTKVYSEIARSVYAPQFLTAISESKPEPDFASVYWAPAYEIEVVEKAYAEAHRLTAGFSKTDVESLARTLIEAPSSLLAFRLILGLTTSEFSQAARLVSVNDKHLTMSKVRIDALESGRPAAKDIAVHCATTIDQIMRRRIFGSPAVGTRSKLDKPDTIKGWKSVREFAAGGVPFAVFLHQRLYGGAFNQLLNATGRLKGNSLELAVAQTFDRTGIQYLRTGSEYQKDIKKRFGLTVRPAPDFVVFDRRNALRAILECKVTSDGGTARDKASRFRSLRNEAAKLGGVPVIAILAGVGWRRASDALGPVIRDTDGRVFTPATLAQIITIQPFSTLIAED